MTTIGLNDLGRNGIEKNLLMQFAFENKPGYFGYPVLNGMGIEESMIKHYPVKISFHIYILLPASRNHPLAL